jgi:hypothetical protein
MGKARKCCGILINASGRLLGAPDLAIGTSAGADNESLVDREVKLKLYSSHRCRNISGLRALIGAIATNARNLSPLREIWRFKLAVTFIRQ